MSEDYKRNATASWSGFSHQGQVGILIALRELQKDNVDEDNTFVQFEKHEDVAIFSKTDREIRYLGVHQVKAYYSNGANNKSKYKSVLNGDFEDGEERYLHTVVEINDWDTSATENLNNIKRFEYENDIYHCGTTEIENYIKKELVKLIGDNKGKVESAIKRLTYKLDLKIRNEHQKETKNLFDIKFSLSELRTFIFEESEFLLNEIFECRKLFYNLYIESKKMSSLSKPEIVNVDKLIDKVYHHLSDEKFLIFIKRLNLSRSPENLSSTQSVFNEDGLKQVFFKLLMNLNVCPDLDSNDLTLVYFELNYRLTTIIDDEDDAKEVVRNILNNLESQMVLWENTNLINRNINGAFHKFNPDFFDTRNKEEKAEDFNKFMNYNGSTSFICRETAKTNLENE